MTDKIITPAEIHVCRDDYDNFYTITGSPEAGYMVVSTCLSFQHFSGNAYGSQRLLLDKKRPKKSQHIFKTLARAKKAIQGGGGWDSPFSSCDLGQDY